MIDYAHKETDKIIDDLGKSFRKEYAKAYLETSQKLNDYLKGFEKRDEAKRKALEDAKKSDISIDEKRKLEREYKDWRVNQMLTGDRWKEMLDTLSKDYINANDTARALVNDKALDVYALNHNYGTYQVEKETLLDTSYTLYDRSTVNRLISKNPKMLPEASERTKERIRKNKEKIWCQQKLQSAILQGVVQGEPLMKIASRLRTVSNMTTAQSMRNARTMLTNAQSAGRYDSYRRAKDMGLNIKVVWIATLDQHTRHEHRMLDGQMQDVDEPFLVDGEKIMYPADFGGSDYKVPPELIYNCRCTIGAAVPGTKLYEEGLEGIERFSRLEGMSYEEWKGLHEEEDTAATEHVVAQGRDISATWTRRPDKFDFEIEDVINAQGFDGKPRVVSREEFDAAVKAANGGNGFIAQRTYSAPDQETLDAYREQLYNGKWYVDCSTGGAQYGQGMYCAADYTGKLSDGIKTEMDHYIELQDRRMGYSSSQAITDAKYKYANEERDKIYNSINGEKEQAMFRREFLHKGTADDRKLLKSLSDDEYDEMYERLLNVKEAGDRAYKNATNLSDKDIAEMFGIKAHAPHYVETITLDPSARIIKYADARTEIIANHAKVEYNLTESEVHIIKSVGMKKGADFRNAAAALKSENPNLYNAYQNSRHWFSDAEDNETFDIGAEIVKLGYDAINAEKHGQSDSYTVILNRTKVIILEDN